MKTIFTVVVFIISASFITASDWETYELIDRLLTIPEPGAPVIHENSVIFTAPSDIRRVGISFAHENFSAIYWFRQLLVPQDRLLTGSLDRYRDSGIQFHVYQVPDDIDELEYRLVINGLWTTDPGNDNTRRDPVSGLSFSVLPIPARASRPNLVMNMPKGLNFSFTGPPGEIVTVAGNFNGWDPFMYELKEGPKGTYSLSVPLPPGIYQYVFFHRGQRYTDPNNPRRIYSRDGSAASEIVIQ